jgi:hypothetical protein
VAIPLIKLAFKRVYRRRRQSMSFVQIFVEHRAHLLQLAMSHRLPVI